MPVRVKQRDITDCGASCIASVASYYHLDVPVSRIRQLASTDKKGTNVLGLLEALEKLGFQAKGVRGEMESLSKIPKPAIAHIVIKESLHHYVVIYGSAKNYIEIMDPGDGQMRRYKKEEFQKIWTGVLVITIPGEGFQPSSQNISLFSRLWKLILPHRGAMLGALVGALAYTAIGLSSSVYVQRIIDYVLTAGNRNLLDLLSIVMIVLLLVQVIVGSLKSVLTMRTGQLIDTRLILGYYQHLLRLPQPFFDTMRVGEIISRINDAVKIRAFINDALTNIAVNLFTVILSFALMFIYYWKLALMVLAIVPFYVLVYAITNLLNKKIERKLMEGAAELESQLVESLNSISTIKSFGLEDHANVKTETKFISLLKKVYTSGLNSLFTSSATEFLSRLFIILLLWIGAGFVLDKEITPGELLSFYALIAYFTGPVNGLIGSNKVAQNALIASDRLFEIMDLEVEKKENKIQFIPELSGNIRFVNVNFRYGTRVTVFENFNLQIPKGKVTAIVGESGSGKSTLMALLQNLYPLQAGHVFLGECDLRYIQNDSLRNFIAVVPQKIDLFAGHVVDNIAIGDDYPDMKKILSICSGLGILEFIEQLPDGFNTYLGENGATLSGGQKQRIAIARALYRDPEILILDEATSSLDSTSEDYVLKMVDIIRQRGKTVIIISHRLSSVRHADRIVVLAQGKVVEEGTHEELIGNKKEYSQFWNGQFSP